LSQPHIDQRASVVVATYDEEQFIGNCLDSLLCQDYPLDRIEILVMDGGSSDRTRDIVHRYTADYANIRLLENRRRHQTAAYNLGLRESTGQYVLILGAHSVVAPDYVRKCVSLLETTGAANVGGVQRAIGTSYVSSAIALAMSSPFGVGDAIFRYAEKEAYVDSVFGGAWKKETLEQLGGFNEALPGNEDYELNHRLRQRGGKILLSPSIRIFYYNRSSLRSLARQYFRYGYHKAYMLQLHPESLRWRQIVPPLFVITTLASAALSFLGSWLGFLVPAAYLATNLSVSLATAFRQGLRYVAVLPVAFGVLHFSWGTGFLAGVIRGGGWRQALSLLALGMRRAIAGRTKSVSQVNE
jgi:succinoglycan biosynthesis protein ExoA